MRAGWQRDGLRSGFYGHPITVLNLRLPMTKHPVVHFEIGCFSGDETRTFLSDLFGWNISDRASGYTIETGTAVDLSGHIVELAPEWGTYITLYVEVENLESYLDKAEILGGKTLVKPVELPGRGRFAWLALPEGNIIGLWQPASQ